MTRPARTLCFAIGILAVGVAVAMLLTARLGVAPFDVANSGLARHLGVGVGTASWVVGGVMVVAAWALGRRPKPGTLVSMLGIGLVIDLTAARLSTPRPLLGRAGLLAVALVTLWSGITALVLARFGAGPAEELMLALVERGRSLRVARWIVEVGLFAAGLALGGQVGLAAVILVCGTGPVLALVLPPLERRLHEPVHVEVPPVL